MKMTIDQLIALYIKHFGRRYVSLQEIEEKALSLGCSRVFAAMSTDEELLKFIDEKTSF